MTAAQPGAAMTTDRIDLIDKNDTRRMLFRLLEHIANPRRTDTDEHFDEVRTGNRKERHLRFTGDCPGKQRFTRARRTDHQHALRNLAAQALKLRRILQKLDDLADFFLGFLDTRDVLKRDVDLILTEQARLALAERHRATATGTALHLAHEIHPDADQQQNRERINKQADQYVLALRRRRP